MSEKRVYLRILEREDIPRTQKWLNDPEISVLMGYLPTMPLVQQLQWYDGIVNDKTRAIFAICLKETDEHIGNVALGRIDYINRHAMASLFIYEQHHRRQGYGTEAQQLLLDFAFKRLNLHRIYSQVSPTSLGMIKVNESLGFVREGVFREHHFNNGVYTDKILFGLLRSEYLLR